MNPLSNSSSSPNISQASFPTVRYKQQDATQPFDAGVAKRGVTPHEAVMSALIDAGKAKPGTPFEAVMSVVNDPSSQGLSKLKLNGKFEQQDGTFGGEEAVADIHLSGDRAYFKFNLMWVVQAEDKNKNAVTVYVKQEIFTNVEIPANTSELAEAKQRAFKLAKSFELLQKMAITNKSNPSFTKENLEEIKKLATLTFPKVKVPDSAGNMTESKFVKLQDANIQLDSFYTEAKKTVDVAKQGLSKERYYSENIAVYLRNERPSAFSPQRRTATSPFSGVSSSSTSAPKSSANAPRSVSIVGSSPPSDVESDDEEFASAASESGVEEAEVSKDTLEKAKSALKEAEGRWEAVEEEDNGVPEMSYEEEIEYGAPTKEILDEESGWVHVPEEVKGFDIVDSKSANEIKTAQGVTSDNRSHFESAEKSLKELRQLLTDPEIVSAGESERTGQQVTAEKAGTVWQSVLHARKAASEWLKLQDDILALSKAAPPSEEDDIGAGLFPAEDLPAIELDRLRRAEEKAYGELLDRSIFVYKLHKLNTNILNQLDMILGDSDEIEIRKQKIRREVKSLAAIFKQIING